jgi:hypothetical protein
MDLEGQKSILIFLKRRWEFSVPAETGRRLRHYLVCLKRRFKFVIDVETPNLGVSTIYNA